MTKTKTDIPLDIPTLARWLSLEPKANVKSLEGFLLKASQEQYTRLSDNARIALKWAWDEQPEVFFPLVNPWLKGTNAKLRRIAIGALPLTHPDFTEKSVKVLKKLMVDKDRATRITAIDFLAENVDQNIELIKRWLKDPDPAVRAIATRHVQNLDPEKVKAFLPNLEPLVLDPDPEVHWTATSTLLELYEREPRPVLEVMRAMINADDENVRAAAAAGFFEHVLADHFDNLLPTLRSWLRAGDPWLRWVLVRSLRFVRVTPRSMQLLRAIYDRSDKEPELRRRLVQVLINLYDPFDEQSASIRDLFRRARHDPSKRVREAVDPALEEWGEDFMGEARKDPEDE